jgi:hypothetical protein
MNVGNERSVSLWMRTPVMDDAPSLGTNVNTDVAMVGSGIAGMSVAFELSKNGKDVVDCEHTMEAIQFGRRSDRHAAPGAAELIATKRRWSRRPSGRETRSGGLNPACSSRSREA